LTHYVIIGGTACNLIYAKYGIVERSTKDIDMVIVAEAFDREFYSRFVSFVRDGGYQHRSKDGRYELYRFDHPSDVAFPAQVELLSKKPEYLDELRGALGHIETIDASGSLSAIMLDDDYYALLDDGVEVIDGLPVLSLKYLPVFKMHAWANLMDERTRGKRVDSREIGKHRKDVLRLCSLFAPSERVELTEAVRQDVQRFVDECSWTDEMLRGLGLRISSEGMRDVIRSVYLDGA